MRASRLSVTRVLVLCVLGLLGIGARAGGSRLRGGLTGTGRKLQSAAAEAAASQPAIYTTFVADCWGPVVSYVDSAYCYSKYMNDCVERLQPATSNGKDLRYFTQTYECPSAAAYSQYNAAKAAARADSEEQQNRLARSVEKAAQNLAENGGNGGDQGGNTAAPTGNNLRQGGGNEGDEGNEGSCEGREGLNCRG